MAPQGGTLDLLQDNVAGGSKPGARASDTLGAMQSMRSSKGRMTSTLGTSGRPIDQDYNSLSMESSYLSRTGREPSQDEIMEYLSKHNLQKFITDVIMNVARHFPPDPFDFLLNHIEAMVMEHRSSGGMVDSKHAPAPKAPVPSDAPSMTREKQEQVLQHLVIVLQHPDLTQSSALKLFLQFAANEEKMMEDEFTKLSDHIGSSWGLDEVDKRIMQDVLKRWRFRSNAASGTRGLPLWPMTKDDFVKAYPSLIRAVRDRYVPIGGTIHRSLFVRRSTVPIADRYDKGPILGRGAYGEVVLVTLKDTGERRVCKKVNRDQQKVPEEELNEEIELLRAMDHPHIIRVFEYFATETNIEMVMEPVFGGTLTKVVQGLYFKEDGEPFGKRPEALTEGWIAAVLAQLLGALSYAHEVAGVVHKDLKTDNVLMVAKPGLKTLELLAEPVHAMLADFGIAEVFSSTTTFPIVQEHKPDAGHLPPMAGTNPVRRSTRVGGTPSYMSPEMFKGSFTEKSDMWSLGVMIFQMFTGELPYQAQNVMMQANLVCNPRRHPRWEILSAYNWSIGARWFCQQLLSKDEGMRPSAKEAVKNDWILKAQASFETAPPTDAEKQAIMNQHLQSHLMRMAMTAITSQLSLSQLHHLNLSFKRYDSTGDGRLGTVEARQVLQDVGGISEEDANLLIEALDGDHSGLIEYSEFVSACLDLSSDSVRKHLNTAFNIFDLDGSGKLTLEELRQVLTHGANMVAAPTRLSASQTTPATTILPDGKTVEQVMDQVDSDHSGYVDRWEFQRYLVAEHESAGTALHKASKSGR